MIQEDTIIQEVKMLPATTMVGREFLPLAPLDKPSLILQQTDERTDSEERSHQKLAMGQN